MKQKTILIVEDDETLNEGIHMTLDNPDFRIKQTYTIGQAREVLAENELDLILLDVNLPDGDGFAFCKEIRMERDTPVIFLTARDMELDVVRGLEMGGDDYITKPFSLMVLRARVNSVLRRYEGVVKPTEVRLRDLTFDFDNMLFLRGTEKLSFSKTEQKLLRALVINRGRVLSKEQLLDQVWDGEGAFVDDHALTVTIKRLRGKLERDPSKPEYIKNVYGIGYIWAKEEENG